MKNFTSENNHSSEKASTWFTDITESINNTYKKQLNMSVDLYNQFLSFPFTKETTAAMEDLSGMKFLKNNINQAEKNIEKFTDLMLQTNRLSTESFFSAKPEFISEKTTENISNFYESQIEIMKNLNSYFFEIWKTNSEQTLADYSTIIKKFSENVEKNLNFAAESAKSISTSDNKSSLEGLNKQFDQMAKVNLEFWTDAMNSLNKVSVKSQKDWNWNGSSTENSAQEKTKKETENWKEKSENNWKDSAHKSEPILDTNKKKHAKEFNHR
ncbi:MAG: hypothetical protein V4608_17325 [Bacteroidota bacterium]